MQKFTITTKNTIGVLRRVAGIFARKGYNIETINAAPQNGVSVIEIASDLNEEQTIELIKILKKLYDVTNVKAG